MLSGQCDGQPANTQARDNRVGRQPDPIGPLHHDGQSQGNGDQTNAQSDQLTVNAALAQFFGAYDAFSDGGAEQPDPPGQRNIKDDPEPEGQQVAGHAKNADAVGDDIGEDGGGDYQAQGFQGKEPFFMMPAGPG